MLMIEEPSINKELAVLRLRTVQNMLHCLRMEDIILDATWCYLNQKLIDVADFIEKDMETK